LVFIGGKRGERATTLVQSWHRGSGVAGRPLGSRP
jgi:hypothetical protein